MNEPRHTTVDVCAECHECRGDRCAPARGALRNYGGIRFTSDGFDCALPVSIDSHSHCSYGCLYCFSDNLMSHREGTTAPVGQTNLKHIERVFAGEGGRQAALLRKALRYGTGTYPCPVQVGALNDPCDHIERQQGWLLKFIELAIKYRQPVRISTKGTVLSLPEYQRALSKAPELFWVAFSIITSDDDLLQRIDRRAPNATERLQTMADLSRIGVRTSLRLRPMLAGVTDAMYEDLIEKASRAGVYAISYETAFYPGMPPAGVRWRWEELSRIAGVPYKKVYGQFGRMQACTRPSFLWTENIMHAVHDKAKECGLVVGVSDPVWKQLGETGCCCGMLPGDPVFGNWQPEGATNMLLQARDTGRLVGPRDVTPPWAYDVLTVQLVDGGAGPLVRYKCRHETWADKIRQVWNGLDRQRGPLVYFQGAMMPHHQSEEGDWFFEYKGLKRQHAGQPYWKLPRDTTTSQGEQP